MSSGAGASVLLIVGVGTDTHDVSPGNGVCADAVGQCSLRAAIDEVNASSSSLAPFTINIDVATVTLTIPGANENANISGDLDIRQTGKVTIKSKINSVVSGSQLDRVIHARIKTDVTLLGLTIADGSLPFASSLSDVSGGGVLAEGLRFDLRGTTVRNNLADTIGGGVAIKDVGTVNIAASVISNNQVRARKESQSGGGLAAWATAGQGRTMSIDRLDLVGNSIGVPTWVPPTGVFGGASGGGAIVVGYAGHLGGLKVTGNSIDAFPASSGAIGNQYDGAGGGLYLIGGCSGEVPVVTGSSIAGNWVARGVGGGIAFGKTGCSLSTETVSSSLVENNVVRNGAGGGVSFGSFDYPGSHATTLETSVIRGNSANESTAYWNMAGRGSGGGVLSQYSSTSPARIRNSTIQSNTATRGGGGLVIVPISSTATNGMVPSGSGGAQLDNLTIADNVSNSSTPAGTTLPPVLFTASPTGSAGGGGIYIYQSVVLAEHLTLSGNDRTNIWTDGNSTVVKLNRSAIDAPGPLSGTLSCWAFVLFGSGPTLAAPTSTSVNPCGGATQTASLLLGPLAANGGSWAGLTMVAPMTRLPGATSPLRNPANGGCSLTTDQRGAARPLGGPNCDRGSVEVG